MLKLKNIPGRMKNRINKRSGGQLDSWSVDQEKRNQKEPSLMMFLMMFVHFHQKSLKE